MHFTFDWETEADHISFDDSDRFEEDSLCSWNSEPESLCNNWRGWKRQNGGQAFPAQQQQQQRTTGDKIVTLVEMSAQAVACHIPFEVVENFRQPVPDQLQLRIAFWSFPENEEDIRLYSCLANGSSDEFQKGEHLYKMKAVKEALQIGFHLSATVDPSQTSTQGKGSYNVAVVFDRRRITSCMCTCGSTAWCSHVVALCLYRIHQSHSVCLRAPVSESLSRLRRDQLQKFAQYLISELPQQILPTAQKLLDELLSSQETAMNTVYGAPDPTAGPSASEQTSWCLDPDTLHENIKKTLVKHCLPTPMVFSDVNYLSSSAPPAAAEWQSLLRPLRGREPEGMWNLLSIVCEMFRRCDNNAVPLLEILTDEVLQCEQILVWWFATKMSSSHSGNSNHVNRCNSNSSANASQHAAASFCDEIVTLWRLAALNPKLSPIQRDDLCTKFRDWHISTIDKVKKIRGSSFGLKKTDIENFCGFKPAVEACSLDWEEYNIPGVTYSEGLGTQYHISRIQETETKKLSRVQTVAVCSQDLISSDSSTRCTHPAMNFDPTASTDLREQPHYFFKNIPGPGLMSFDVGNMDSVLSSGSEGFCEPDKSDTETTRNSSGSNGKNKVNHQESHDKSEYRGSCQNYKGNNLGDSVKFSVVVSDTNGDSDASLPGTSGCQNGAKTPAQPSEQGGESPRLEPSLSAESQPSSDEYQLYFYDTKVLVKTSESEKKKKDKTDEPNYFFGLKTSYSKQDIWFARAEALHTHGHNKEACKLAQKLAEEILANPPDFLAEANTISVPKGKKKKLQNSVSLLASQTLAKAAFLCNVLSEDPECYPLAFNIAMFGLEMPRPPASNKVLEVKLAYQESELLTLLKKIPLGQSELNILREKAEQLRDGKLQSRGEALLPLTLASFIFDLFCMPASPACSNNGKSPNRSQAQVLTKLPSYEKLGFEAAVAALGLKANVSEAEHPLLCEGTRRQRGDLAITMLVHYKDDQTKLSKIIDKLLDKEVHQMYKAPSLSTYLSNKSSSHQPLSSTAANSETGAKRTKLGSCTDPNTATTTNKSSSTQNVSISSSASSQLQVKEESSTTAVTAAVASTSNTVSNHSASSSSAGRLDLPQSGMLMGSSGSVGGDPDQSGWQNSPAQRLDYLNLEQGQATSNHSTGARPKTMYSLKYNSGKDTDSSALEEDGDDLKALEARIRCMTLRKKPSQGMASIDSSAPETTSSDNSPTLIRRSWSKHQGPGSDSGSSGKSSDSLGSSSSEEKVAVNCNKVRDNESLTNPFLARISSLVLIDSRMPSNNMKTIRYKGKRIIPTTPNQPSEASAHFMFELAKNVLFKAGGNSSTSLFTRPTNNNNNPTGPHRNLHLCAFQIGLYALGLHNCVSPNWLSRTYSSHVSWITGQAMEIGSAAINILIDTWEGHLTPPEVASLADRASRGRDPNMVKAASELSLSSLPHAHALNPNEVQRALLQCKEHSKEMLEKACLAVESAAKGGGVYPEVLFEVARHWDKMAEESAHLTNNGGAQGDLSVASKASHCHDDDSNRPLMECVGEQINPSSNNSSALPMIPYNQQPNHTSSNSQINTQGIPPPPPPPPPPQIILHSSNHMNHPGPMVIPYTLPGPAQNNQMPHHPAPYVPTYSIFNHHHHHQYPPPPPPPPPPQTSHIPLHNNMHHPGAYITTYSYQNQSPFPVGNLQNIQNVHQNTAQIFSNGTNIRHLGGPTMQIYPNSNCQLGSLQPVHGGNTATASAGNVDQPSVFTPCQPTSSNCVPGQQQQQQQPIGQSNIPTPSAINNQTQMNYLMAAYRVGMLAMETLSRNDRPQMKYARNPPYGEDVKRLLRVAIKLGSSYLQQFCASAVNAVVSPFVLYDIAWEAAHYLAHNNQTPVHNCLRSNFLNPLVQKCIQMFMHCAHHRIHHITSSEYDDFVGIICTAQKAFCMSPGGPVQFNELLQSLRRSKSCRKELWQKIVNGLTRGTCNVASSKISL